MKGKKYLWILPIVLLFTVVMHVPVRASPEVRVYVSMPDSYIPGKPVGTKFYIDLYIESPTEWENTTDGIVGWSLYLKVDPTVLEPLTVKGGEGYFLYDFIDYYEYYGHEPKLLVASIDKTEGLFSDIAEMIFGWEALGVGAGGSGMICSLRVKSLDETTYSLIDIFEAYYYTPAGMFPVDVVEDGHYNELAIDTLPPAWSDEGTNNTIAGQPTLFHAKWTDNFGLSGFIFGTDNTGTWTNDTWTSMSGTADWSNVTKTLNSTPGKVVQWRVWANDTSNNWNDTGILSLTTTLPPIHDVAIDSATAFSTEVFFRQLVNINVIVKNNGTTAETFYVTVYRNDTAIGTETVTDLAAGADLTLTFTWDTADALKGTYTIRAEAGVVPGETDTDDNTLTDGTVEVKITDANSDECVNEVDLEMLRGAYGTISGEPHYDPQVDFDGDSRVGYKDLFLLACNWGYGG